MNHVDMIFPIRVLHVVSEMGTGGIQQFLINIYRHIDRTKIQFDFLIHRKTECGFEDEIRSLGGRIFYIEPISIRTVTRYTPVVQHFLASHTEYQIIHIHMRTVAALCATAAKREGRIVIIHSHNTTNGYGLISIVKNAFQFPVRYLADYYMGCSVMANEWMFGKKIANSD